MTLIPQDTLRRMKGCFALLPEPGADVASMLYDHILELEQQISSLKYEARKYYTGDEGIYEILDSPEEVTQRRIKAAKKLKELLSLN